MFRSKNHTAKKSTLSLMLMACAPVMTGCVDPVTAGVTLFGGIFWIDLALIPVRSVLGSIALNIVNTV